MGCTGCIGNTLSSSSPLAEKDGLSGLVTRVQQRSPHATLALCVVGLATLTRQCQRQGRGDVPAKAEAALLRLAVTHPGVRGEKSVCIALHCGRGSGFKKSRGGCVGLAAYRGTCHSHPGSRAYTMYLSWVHN